jgi:hypothetical protein
LVLSANPVTIASSSQIFPKGKLGEDKANLLNSLLTTQFQLAAMSRANVAEEERRDFFLFIDEFHNFTDFTPFSRFAAIPSNPDHPWRTIEKSTN